MANEKRTTITMEDLKNMAYKPETITGELVFNHLNSLIDQIDHAVDVLRQLRSEALAMGLKDNKVKFDEIIDEMNTISDEAERLLIQFHIAKGFARPSLTRDEIEYLNKNISAVNEKTYERFLRKI